MIGLGFQGFLGLGAIYPAVSVALKNLQSWLGVGHGVLHKGGQDVSRFENISVLGRAVSVTFAINIITDIPRTNLAVPRGGNA
jgi:hypothetical protein